MSNIFEFDTKADAVSLHTAINNKLVELTGVSDLIFTDIRQPDKVDYNFWVFEDPRNRFGQYSGEMDNIINNTSVTFRAKSLPYEYDYTDEDSTFFGQKLGYN